MEDSNKDNNTKSEDESGKQIYGLLKISQLKKRTNAYRYLLRKEDVIVALEGIIFRGDTKKLNETLKIEDKSILTIQRKEHFFQLVVDGPLGVKLEELSKEETAEIIEKFNKSGLDKIKEHKHYEVFRGPKHSYKIIEDSQSILASILPPIWLMYQRLFAPLALLISTYILLGSIAWLLFLSAWVIVSIYMAKGSMSLLRGYAMLKDMKLYMYISSKNLKSAQEMVRNIDKKSLFDFSMITLPENIQSDNLANKSEVNPSDSQTSAIV